MNDYNLLKSRRMWFIPDFVVWGIPGWKPVDYVASVNADSDTLLYYGSVSPGSSDQTINYNELADHRGNNLPDEIASPKVIVCPKSSGNAFVTGSESNRNFKIARDASIGNPVRVDLLIIEMGG